MQCKRFLLIDCVEDDQRIVIFCSDLKLKLLVTSKRIGVDGTFKSCPEIFAQVYIIMAWYMGECLPVTFCLLGGKKESIYRRMLFPQSDLVDAFFILVNVYFVIFVTLVLKHVTLKIKNLRSGSICV